MLILLANPSRLRCQSITGSPAIARQLNGNGLAKKLETQPMGTPNGISATLSDRIFRLIQTEFNLKASIHSERDRQSPKPT